MLRYWLPELGRLRDERMGRVIAVGRLVGTVVRGEDERNFWCFEKGRRRRDAKAEFAVVEIDVDFEVEGVVSGGIWIGVIVMR